MGGGRAIRDDAIDGTATRRIPFLRRARLRWRSRERAPRHGGLQAGSRWRNWPRAPSRGDPDGPRRPGAGRGRRRGGRAGPLRGRWRRRRLDLGVPRRGDRRGWGSEPRADRRRPHRQRRGDRQRTRVRGAGSELHGRGGPGAQAPAHRARSGHAGGRRRADGVRAGVRVRLGAAAGARDRRRHRSADRRRRNPLLRASRRAIDVGKRGKQVGARHHQRGGRGAGVLARRGGGAGVRSSGLLRDRRRGRLLRRDRPGRPDRKLRGRVPARVPMRGRRL